MFRVSLSLKKDESIKFISHLDFVQAFEYGLRRSRLPIAFSEGFNPRPKMSFGNAVGVGVSSEDERIVLELKEQIDDTEIKNRLNANLPNGLQVMSSNNIEDGEKSPLSSLNASDYRIIIETKNKNDIRQVIKEINNSEEYTAVRMKSGEPKTVNFRPYIISFEADDIDDDSILLKISFRTTNNGGGRPQDIIQILTAKIPEITVTEIKRIRQYNENC